MSYTIETRHSKRRGRDGRPVGSTVFVERFEDDDNARYIYERYRALGLAATMLEEGEVVDCVAWCGEDDYKNLHCPRLSGCRLV